jgi:hypothetical protein
MAGLARQVISETATELQLNSDHLSRPVRDRLGGYENAIDDQIKTGQQLEADYAELNAKKDLVPVEAWDRLREQAIAEAQQRSDAADRRAERELAGLIAEVKSDALPRLDPKREPLARQELEAGLGNKTGQAARSAVMDLAQHGSREALSALFTDYGRTLLAGRGVTGPDLDETLENARTFAAYRTDGGTVREIIASKALLGIDRLGGARGAAGSYTAGLIRRGRCRTTNS